jgi:hypothetical protein
VRLTDLEKRSQYGITQTATPLRWGDCDLVDPHLWRLVRVDIMDR